MGELKVQGDPASKSKVDMIKTYSINLLAPLSRERGGRERQTDRQGQRQRELQQSIFIIQRNLAVLFSLLVFE